MNPLELHAARSRWAKRHVGEKALLFLGLAIVAVAVPPGALIATAPVVLVAAWRSGVRWGLYLPLVLAPAAFITLGILPLILSITTSGITIHADQLPQAGAVAARSFTATASVIAFTLCTPMAEIISWLRLPGPLSFVVMSMYRQTVMLVLTARKMFQVQAMRLGHSSRSRWVRSVAHQAASLFVVSFHRSRRLQEGLSFRADITAFQVLSHQRALSVPRICLFTALLVGLCALGVWL